MVASRKSPQITEKSQDPLKDKIEVNKIHIQNTQESVVDVCKMTFEDLVSLARQINDELKIRKAKAISELRKDTEQKAAKLGIRIEEIFPTSPERSEESKETPKRKKRLDAGVKQQPYYRNPDNPSQVAYNKGKRPEWMKNKLAEGMELGQLVIANQNTPAT